MKYIFGEQELPVFIKHVNTLLREKSVDNLTVSSSEEDIKRCIFEALAERCELPKKGCF